MTRRVTSLVAGLLGVAAALPASAGGRHGMVAAPGFRGQHIVITSPFTASRPGQVPPRIVVRAAPTILPVLIGRQAITPVIIENPFLPVVPAVDVVPPREIARNKFGLAAPEAAALFLLDARPLDAHVFFDGRFVGTAGDFRAQAFAIPSSQHTVKITATGFHPFVANIESRPTLPTSLRVSLTPE